MRLPLLGILVLGACQHGEPFGPADPHNEGPRGTGVPRQLTYSTLDDRAPEVIGNDVRYSVAPIGDDPRARCLALLPVEGGQAISLACPPAPADTFLHAWDEPATSPDGAMLAFLWVRSPRFSALGAWTHELVVSAADHPETPSLRHVLGGSRADGRHVNTVTQLRWVNDRTVRFVAAYDSIWKVKDGGAARFTDSAINPVILMDLDVVTGVLTDVPGGDSVVAWAPSSLGGVWLVRQARPGTVEWVDLSGARVDIGTVPAPVTALVEAGDRVAAGTAAGGLFLLNPADGARESLVSPVSGPVHRLSWHAGTRLLVMAAEPAPAPFGASANLWLVGRDDPPP